MPADAWADRVRAAAVRHGVPADRFERQIRHESAGYAADVIACRRDSPAGARGIAQLMPVHWSAVDPCDPEAALDYAARLMAGHLAYWRGQGYAAPSDVALALASYNAGRQATIDGVAGRNPRWPYAETVTYVQIILGVSTGDARALLAGGTIAVPEPALKLSDVLARARSRIGDPYVWGGKEPPRTDCSGFLAWCYGGKVRSFTDFIFEDTARVASPAPGDIVLWQYADPGQPGVRFPHAGLFLSDAETLDNRYPDGVGVRPQLPRSSATRYYRRLAGVVVDTLGEPAPAPPPPVVDPRDERIAHLERELDSARNLVGNAYNADGEVRKALAALRQQVAALDAWLARHATR